MEGIPLCMAAMYVFTFQSLYTWEKSRPAMNGKIDRSQRREAREWEIERCRGRKREMKTETRREALQKKLTIRPSARARARTHTHTKRIHQTIQTYTNTAVMSVNKRSSTLFGPSSSHCSTARHFLEPCGLISVTWGKCNAIRTSLHRGVTNAIWTQVYRAVLFVPSSKCLNTA